MIEANYYPPNGYPYTTCKDLRGTSEDIKPSDVPEGSTFHEWDTGDEYMFSGSAWIKQSGGGGGGASFGNASMLILCAFSGGAPDPDGMGASYINTYQSQADLTAGSVLVGPAMSSPADDMVPFVASGVVVSAEPVPQIADTATVGLYMVDEEFNATEIPDAITPATDGGYYTAFDFTMPEATEGSFVVIGYE